MPVVVGSREYKFLVPADSVEPEGFRAKVRDAAKAAGLGHRDLDPKGVSDRAVCFLDTADHALRERFGLVLRAREQDGTLELTLKRRGPDRYRVAGAPLRARRSLDPEEKLEEDILWPFQSRYSRSIKVVVPSLPRTWAEAAEAFPSLPDLDADLPLDVVGDRRVSERVWTFGKLRAAEHTPDETKVSVALITWSPGSGPPAVAEVSFRYESQEDDAEVFPFAVADAAWTFADLLFAGLSGVSGTKTAWAYGA